jgi:hypothetical protein
LHALAQKATIQKSTAVLLLLVFLTSIAPRAFFHDMVANHEDLPDCRQLHHSTVLHQQGFNCHFDDLVVSVPIALLSDPAFVFTDFNFANNPASFYFSPTQSVFQHKESRGPPTI